MKSIKEILLLMLYAATRSDAEFSGLCGLVARIWSKSLITDDEKGLIMSYIKANRPSKWSSFAAFDYKNDYRYFWEPYYKKPRIKWLRKHVKLNS